MVLLQKSKNSDLLFRLWGVSGFIFPPLSWSIVILALDTCLLSQTNFFVIFHNQCFGKYLKWRWKLFEFGGHFTASFLVEDLCDCCEQKKTCCLQKLKFSCISLYVYFSTNMPIRRFRILVLSCLLIPRSLVWAKRSQTSFVQFCLEEAVRDTIVLWHQN